MTNTVYIKDLLKKNARLISFEVFPPKTEKGLDNLLTHLKILEKFYPDFLSVTYGAGGTTQNKSLDVLKMVLENFSIPVLAHFTCVGFNKKTIDSFISHLTLLKITNILALRGDPTINDPDFSFNNNCFTYASQLVAYLKQKTPMCIGVAGHPEEI